jgi:hypothetical protein
VDDTRHLKEFAHQSLHFGYWSRRGAEQALTNPSNVTFGHALDPEATGPPPGGIKAGFRYLKNTYRDL